MDSTQKTREREPAWRWPSASGHISSMRRPRKPEPAWRRRQRHQRSRARVPMQVAKAHSMMEQRDSSGLVHVARQFVNSSRNALGTTEVQRVDGNVEITKNNEPEGCDLASVCPNAVIRIHQRNKFDVNVMSALERVGLTHMVGTVTEELGIQSISDFTFFAQV